MSENIIKNESKAYGYNYASLADMARQGVKIPQMTTKLVDGVEYVYYKDGENWLQGARVVTTLAMKGMNEAQAYGSALTYARRYTVAMANCIVTDDDDAIERKEEPAPSEKQKEYIKKLLKAKRGFDDEKAARFLAAVKTAGHASDLIGKLVAEGKEWNT